MPCNLRRRNQRRTQYVIQGENVLAKGWLRLRKRIVGEEL